MFLYRIRNEFSCLCGFVAPNYLPMDDTDLEGLDWMRKEIVINFTKALPRYV